MTKTIYLASDYDGTFKQNSTISPYDLDAIRRLRSRGGKFGLVTGRGPGQLQGEFKAFSFTLDFLIACTGALILDGQGNTLFSRPLEQELIPQVFEQAKAQGAALYGLCTKNLHCRLYLDPVLAQTPKFKAFSAPACSLKEALEDGPALSLFITGKNEEESLLLYQSLSKSYQGRLSFHYNKGSIDVTAPGINKAQGVKTLGSLRPDAALYVIGDALNDLEMVRAFHGFCVSNSCPELLEAASMQFKGVGECLEFLMEKAGSVQDAQAR